jgi:enoyl-CoA hydratase
MAVVCVRIEQVEVGVALVTLDRPEKLNALDEQSLRELGAAMEQVSDDRGVDVAILTGAGDAFCAGADLSSLADLNDATTWRHRLRLFSTVFRSIEFADVPVIAAINGAAYGAGVELALAADLVVASDRATFSLKEVTVGLVPAYAAIRGPSIIGKRATRYLALTGRVIDARRAERWGLVDEIADHDELMGSSLELARDIRANAPLGVRVAKHLVNRDQGPPGLAESVEATASLFSTRDHKEGIEAFQQRRAPRFEGR